MGVIFNPHFQKVISHLEYQFITTKPLRSEEKLTPYL